MNTIADFIRKERKKAGLIRQILGYKGIFFDLTENSCISGRMKEEMKGLMETRAGPCPDPDRSFFSREIGSSA